MTVKRFSKLSAVVLLTALAFPAASLGGSTDHGAGFTFASELHRPGEIIIKFRPGTSEHEEARIEKRIGLKTGAPALSFAEDGQEIEVAEVKKGKSVASAIRALSTQPAVEFAEPNYVASVGRVPDDAYYAQYQWSHAKMASEAGWDLETGDRDVVIAVIDTGVDYTHPDLSGKVINGPDFYNDDLDSYDDHGHGTHVAGLAAATTDNGRGVAGVSWESRIMALKVLGSSGYGYYSDIAQAVIYAADNGADIINMSLGGSASSRTLEEAIEYAHDAGVTVIAAAGNSGDNRMSYPAGNPNVVGVGATDSSDNKASFSTYNSSVDVSAPGVGNLSTYPGGWYVSMSGTSMATPHVAGLAALVIAAEPSLAPDDVQARIEQSADDLGQEGRDDYYGHGRINVFRALSGSERDTTAPVNPAIVSSSHGSGAWSRDRTIDVSWSGAADASGVAGYSILWSRDSSDIRAATRNVLAEVTSATSDSLASGQWYFHLRTVDAVGNWSDKTTAGPFRIDIDVPGRPAGLRAVAVGDNRIDVSWDPSTDQGGSGVGQYRIERSVGGWTSWVELSATAATDISDTGVEPGATYYYRVRGVDGAGGLGFFSDPVGVVAGGGQAPVPGRDFQGVTRIWGPTVDGTAAAISQAAWPQSKMVIIARNDHFADGLAAATLAYSYRTAADVGAPAPLLLTNPDRLSEAARNEIERLGASQVLIVGGEGAVAPAVAGELGRISGVGSVERVAGETAPGTARMIFQKTRFITDAADAELSTTAIIVTEANFQDALAVSSPAAANGMPIFLTHPARVPSETLTALSEGGFKKVIIVGGPGAVSTGVERDLEEKGYEVKARLWGQSEYETAVDVATNGRNLFSFTSPGALVIARGDFFGDALAAGVFAARLNPAPLLLVHSGGLSRALSSHLVENRPAIEKVYLMGGPGALSEPILNEIKRLAE